MTKNHFLLFCLFIAVTFAAHAQSPTLNGVYVGAELYTTPFQGMQINNIVIYFRNTGTFNNTLNQETATVTGNMQAVVLTDLVNNRIRAELSQNGRLLLIKQLDGNDGWNKNKLVYLIGSDYTMKGNAYKINASAPNISVYKNFTKVNGITYPAATESSDGRTKLTTTTTAIEFNPVLTDDAWKTP